MEDNEYNPARHYSVAIYIILVVIVFFFYKYNDKFHLIQNSKTDAYSDDAIVTGASVEVGDNTDLSTELYVGSVRAYMKNTKSNSSIVVVTETAEFELDVYTMKNHDVDLGLAIKNESEYPPVLISTISELNTGGLIVETVQTLGTDTYANKIYIKDDKVIDKGFQIRTGIRDNAIYYDNAVLIIDTLNKGSTDIIRIYDDATGNHIIGISNKDVPILNDSEFRLICSAVGNNFISFSDLYTNIGGENFIDFSDNPIEVKSVWAHVGVSVEQLQKLMNYEKQTMGHCLMFQQRNADNELIYIIDYPAKMDINDIITIPLSQKIN